MNLSDWFESIVNSCGDKTALVYKDEKVSYKELSLRVRRLSAAFQKRGLKRGDRISIISPNSERYIEIIIAASRSGLILEHYNFRAGESVLLALVKAAKPKILFAHSEKLAPNRLQGKISEFSEVVFTHEDDTSGSITYEQFVHDSDDKHDPDPGKDDDVAAVLYTSGTTRTPKAVMLTNKNLMFQAMISALETGWKRETVACQAMPLCHIAGLESYCSLVVGGTVVLVDKIEITELVHTIEKNSVTRIGLTPQLIQLLSQLEGKEREAIKSLQTIIYSGSAMPYEILVESEERLSCELYGLYGMTETSSTVCVLGPEEHRAIARSANKIPIPVGRAAVGTQIRIIGDCGDGVGEIVVKNDGVMAGYADSEIIWLKRFGHRIAIPK